MKIELYEREDKSVGIYISGDLNGEIPTSFRLRTQPINGKVYDVNIPLNADDRLDIQEDFEMINRRIQDALLTPSVKAHFKSLVKTPGKQGD